MKSFHIVAGNLLRSECAPVTDKREWLIAINLAIHAAIKALSRLGRVRRVYRQLEELFCSDFLWFLYAHTRVDPCATNRSGARDM